MKLSFLKKRALGGLVALSLALASSVFGQGLTTSAISGTVTNKQGAPVGGATVTVLHEPTATKTATTTRENGQFNLSGLRPGGPYTITAAGSTLRAETRNDVYLELGAATDLGFSLAADTVVMEAFRVSDTRDLTFGAGQLGTTSNFNEQEIENTASVRRNVQDVARLDPRLALLSLDQGGQLSAQGQNFRYNSFLIDGVQANDSFGLNGNGFSSVRSPIPLEAMQALNVELNPVDVRRAGFTGALLNAVTKSGGNTFHGGVYYEFTDQDFRREHPVTGVKDTFEEKNLGAWVSGPIIPDRLFFFLSYDEFKRTTLPPDQLFVPNAADLTAITSRAQALNFAPGGFDPSSAVEQKTYLAKLDWNITPDHRFSFTYRENEGGDTIFSSFGGTTTTSFSSYWYDQFRITKSYTGQLFNTWSPNLRTEFSASFSDYDGSPASRSPAVFPEVIINGVSGARRDNNTNITNGSVRLGTEFSRQLNEITTETETLAGNAEYSLGAHTLVGGFDWENRKVLNKFVQAYIGQFTFANLAAWQAGTPATLLRTLLAPGATIDDAIARFETGMLALYLQDTWKPNDRLTLIGGLRYEQLVMPDAPKAIPNAGTYSEAIFQQAFGMPSTSNPDGNSVVAPRFGFTYQLPASRRTQLRGSAGLFQGRNPLVWLSNAYSNRGVVARQTVTNATFNSNPGTSTGTGGIPVINVTDPDFKTPLTWKGSLALDHTLPFGGLVLTAEFSASQTDQMPFVTNLNLRQTGVLPDGRALFAGGAVAGTNTSRGTSASNPYTNPANYRDPRFADVFYLTNSSKGGGWDTTLRLSKPWKNNWSASLAWTRSDYTEVTPMTSSVAQSNFNGRALVNSNEDVAATSNYNIDDKIVGIFTKRFEFVKRFPTTVSAIFEARTGRPYSWVFFGDANGDGFSFNDLYYVPTGPTDPKVRWTNPTQRDAFFAFAAANGLNNYAGRVVPRNSERSPWVATMDLKVTQTIPLFRRLYSELFVNVINFANLFDKRFGRLEEIPFAYRRALGSTTFDAATNQYVYNYVTADGLPTVANDTAASRWQVQSGIRLKF